MRFDLYLILRSAIGASRRMGSVRDLRRIRELDDGDAIRQLKRRLEAVREPRSNIGPHHDAIHHHIDVVLDLLVERGHVGDLVELAVHLHALEAALLQIGELLAVFALAATDHRREQIKPRAFGQRQHAVHHLAHGLALDRQPGRWRIGHADARPQEPHIIVNLGDGAHRGARVPARRLLLDGDGRRKPVDQVHIGLLHHLQKLPRIGRKALDIAALALGIDRVEGEARLARARQPCDDHELLARNVERNVLEIVLARAAHRDVCLCQNLTRPTFRRRVPTHLYLRAIMAKLKPGAGVTPSYSPACERKPSINSIGFVSQKEFFLGIIIPH